MRHFQATNSISGRNIIRLPLVIIAMVTVAAIFGGWLTLYNLYLSSLLLRQESLISMVRMQERLIESMADYPSGRNDGDSIFKKNDEILQKLRESLKKDHPQDNLEQVFARREGNKIQFILPNDFTDKETAREIDWNDLPIDLPMKEALSGNTGSMIGVDTKGKDVLAAYTYLEPLKLGMVIHLPLAEVRRDYDQAGIYGAGISLALIIFSLIMSRIMFRRMLSFEIDREARYKVIFHAVSVSCVTFRANQIIDCNIACETLFGYSREEIIGERPAFLMIELCDESTTNEKALSEQLSRVLGGVPVQYNRKIHRRNGEIRDVSVSLYSTTYDNEQFFIAVHQDITERLKQEQELKLYKSALEATNSGVIITNHELTDNPIIWANHAFYMTTGYEPEEVVGLNCRFLQGNDRDQSGIKIIRAAIKESKSETAVLRNYRKDGSRFINQLRIDPIMNEDGKVTHFVGILHDITSHIDQEMQLQLYQRAVDQSPISVVITDSKGNIVYVNKQCCEVTGYSESELLGKNPRIFKSSKNDPSIYHELWESITHGKPWVGEIINRKKSGEEYPESAYIFPIRDTDGFITHFVAEKEDLTQQKSNLAEKAVLHDQLLQLQRIETIGTLAGGIAHDFNNLIGAIRGWAELAKRHASGNSKVLDDLEHILSATERSRTLVQQILTYARQNEKHVSRMSMETLVTEIAKLARSTIPSSINIRVSVSDDPTEVEADPAQMQQVILNLITNAAYALKDKNLGEISIKIDRISVHQTHFTAGIGLGEFVRIQVTDNGTGMDQGTLKRIFEPFFTTKPVGEGTGMGLAVSYGIIKSFGGQLSATSELGVGTTFLALLPYSLGKKEEEAPTLPAATRGKDRIMLIDDEPELIELAKRHLGELGYRVIAFTESPKALNFFNESSEDIDIVVTDQLMPVYTGMDLLLEFRKIRPDIPVIILSGYSDSVDLKTLSDLGNVELIAKPYSLSDLTSCIHRRVSS